MGGAGREERICKLENGSDTAIWAANEIRRLDAKVRELEGINRVLEKSLKLSGVDTGGINWLRG